MRDPESAARIHVADGLSGLEVGELRESRCIADVGAGAGFPGLVLAIALPHARVDLIEASGRKAAVAERLARSAKVSNARCVVTRAEEWAARPQAAGGGAGRYDAASARAVAPLAVLAEYGAPLLRLGGVLVAWKGGRDEREEQAAAAAAEQLGLELDPPRRVEPFEGAERHHLYVLRKVLPTPVGFPRRPGMARKRPLG